MSDYLSQKARNIAPYMPGEQPKDRRYIKLNTNENPYPPSPRALAAIAQADGADLRLYTRPEMDELRDAVHDVVGEHRVLRDAQRLRRRDVASNRLPIDAALARDGLDSLLRLPTPQQLSHIQHGELPVGHSALPTATRAVASAA